MTVPSLEGPGNFVAMSAPRAAAAARLRAADKGVFESVRVRRSIDGPSFFPSAFRSCSLSYQSCTQLLKFTSASRSLTAFCLPG